MRLRRCRGSGLCAGDGWRFAGLRAAIRGVGLVMTLCRKVGWVVIGQIKKPAERLQQRRIEVVVFEISDHDLELLL